MALVAYIQESISERFSSQACALLEVLLASLFIGSAAQISVPLPFTPVPLTGQTFAIMCVAALLGGRRGVWATLLYIAQGAVGCPVWSSSQGGIHVMMGVNGGYIAAMPLLAFMVGSVYERCRNWNTILVVATLALPSIVHLACGTLWLSLLTGSDHAMVLGFYPFLPAEIFKACVIFFACSKQ